MTPHQNTKCALWVSFAACFERCDISRMISKGCDGFLFDSEEPRRAISTVSRCRRACAAAVSSHCFFGREIFAPAVPRICRYRGGLRSWQYSPAPGCRGVKSQEFNVWIFTEKPREFIDIYRNFQKFRLASIQRFANRARPLSEGVRALAIAFSRPKKEDFLLRLGWRIIPDSAIS